MVCPDTLDLGQEEDGDDLTDLLIAALDGGGDPIRAAMVLRLINLKSDRDRADAIKRMREIGIPDVFRL